MIHQGNDEKSHHKPHSRLHLPHHLPHWHLPHGHRHHDEGGGLQEESSLSHAHADLEPKWYDRGLSLKVFGWLYDYLHQLRLSHSKASITVRVDSASGLGSGRGSTHHTRGSIAQGVAESLAGAPDPYVKLTLGGVAHTTHVARDTAEPEWDTGYTFKGEVRWLLDEPLAIQVYSRDGKSVMHDSMLGDAELAIGIPLLTSLAQRTARGVSADGYRTFDLPLSSQGAVKFSVAAVVHKPPWAQVIATVLRLDRLSYPLRRWLQGHMAASVNVHIVSGEGLRAYAREIYTLYSTHTPTCLSPPMLSHLTTRTPAAPTSAAPPTPM